VREQWPEQVAREQYPVRGKPHDAAVDRLATWRRIQFEARTADVERVVIVETHVSDRDVLYGRRLRTPRPPGLRREHVREPDRGLRFAHLPDALVVALALRKVALRDQPGARLAEMRDAAHVVHMTLCHDDAGRGTRADRIEELAVGQRLETHSGVDDDAAGVGHDHVGIREPARLPDERVDRDRVLQTRDAIREEVRPALDELSDDVHPGWDSPNAATTLILITAH
jgi:hypothetical protein